MEAACGGSWRHAPPNATPAPDHPHNVMYPHTVIYPHNVIYAQHAHTVLGRRLHVVVGRQVASVVGRRQTSSGGCIRQLGHGACDTTLHVWAQETRRGLTYSHTTQDAPCMRAWVYERIGASEVRRCVYESYATLHAAVPTEASLHSYTRAWVYRGV